MYNEIIVGNTKKRFINKDINFSLKFNLYYFIKYSTIYAAGAGTVKGSAAYGAGAGIVECPAVYSEGAGNVEGPAAYGAGAGTVEGPGPSENTSNRLFFSSAFIALALAAYTCLLVLASQTSWSLAVVAGRNIQHCRSFNNDTCN